MYQIKILQHFKKQLKVLLKKYPALKEDLISELESFDKIKYQSLGNGIYKIRLKVSDLNKGKSGSFRLLVFVVEVEKIVYPMAIYQKNSQENISKQEIVYHLSMVVDEIGLGK